MIESIGLILKSGKGAILHSKSHILWSVFIVWIVRDLPALRNNFLGFTLKCSRVTHVTGIFRLDFHPFNHINYNS